MPVTLHPKPATAFTPVRPRPWTGEAAVSADALFAGACIPEHHRSPRVLKSSFSDADVIEGNICPASNGLVRAAHAAYSAHHHLTFRPEDIWFAVLTQLSFYVNAHAEELRGIFVAHEGQKKLKVFGMGTILTADFGQLAVQMTREMEEHIVAPDLREWILPDFSTTGDNDIVVAAIIMMGTMQKYFEYDLELYCGLPSVTLLGERADYVKICKRLERIVDGGFGKGEPVEFASRLRTVLDYFIRSFDAPKDAQVHDFWSKIAHHVSFGSGPSFMSGWITAFCFWSDDGKPIPTKGMMGESEYCRIDGTTFLPVDTNNIPSGFASVPVKVNDNGTLYSTRMVAGSVGIAASSSMGLDSILGKGKKYLKMRLDSIRPVTGWWMYETK
ncbi:hypothetical protein HK405_010282 [Cladochytrium tenue]|nr:hypothetical protein HK405_010282 [Cladochytrium tenue]